MIKFDKEKYDITHIEDMIHGFEEDGRYVFLIDQDFHVYVRRKDTKNNGLEMLIHMIWNGLICNLLKMQEAKYKM